MKKITISILILIPSLALAQGVTDLKNRSYVSKGAFSFFDPSKLTMHHSYSMSYYTGGGRSGSIGYYMNSIEYEFSNPLKIRVDLGYLHSPTNMFSNGSAASQSGAFVPGFSIDWRPSKHFNFRLDYRQIPQSQLGWSNRYLNPFYREDYR